MRLKGLYESVKTFYHTRPRIESMHLSLVLAYILQAIMQGPGPTERVASDEDPTLFPYTEIVKDLTHVEGFSSLISACFDRSAI